MGTLDNEGARGPALDAPFIQVEVSRSGPPNRVRRIRGGIIDTRMFTYGLIGPICQDFGPICQDFGPIFQESIAVIKTACEEFGPVG